MGAPLCFAMENPCQYEDFATSWTSKALENPRLFLCERRPSPENQNPDASCHATTQEPRHKNQIGAMDQSSKAGFQRPLDRAVSRHRRRGAQFRKQEGNSWRYQSPHHPSLSKSVRHVSCCPRAIFHQTAFKEVRGGRLQKRGPRNLPADVPSGHDLASRPPGRLALLAFTQRLFQNASRVLDSRRRCSLASCCARIAFNSPSPTMPH